MKAQIRSIAQDDITRQYRYYLVHENSPAIADRFFSQVQSAIKQVSKTPKIGQPKTLKNPKLAGLRSWPVNGFPAIRIYYVVRDSGLLINTRIAQQERY